MSYADHLKRIKVKLEQHLISKPVLCKNFTNTKAGSWLQSLRAISRTDQDCVDNMLMREMAEAFSAYQMQDYEKSIDAFENCGAIICRCINFVHEKLQAEHK